jgi:transketolase
MAIAQRGLAARYNRPGFELFGYDVYALAGDGCMMEGLSGEAASLAGHQRLSRLCWIYDNNSITIEGKTALAFSEDVATRFVGYGWNVTRVADANDLKMLERAFATFHATDDRPTLIIVDSHIGYGSPHQDSHKAHGEPLGADGVQASKRAYGWPEDQQFLVPPEVPKHFDEGIGARGAKLRAEWQQLFEKYAKAHPDEARQLRTMWARELPEGWEKGLPSFDADAKGVATRSSSGKVLNGLAKGLPWLLGGAADLAPSTKTLLDGEESLQAASPGGRNLHFGIREHAMGSILNGLAHSGLRPYGAGFLIFSDYMRPPTRLAALMELPVIYVFTHDSIGVGEDGPTHQPIEQLAALRAIPGLLTIRPADANEVVEAWKLIAGLRDEPAALALTRQNVPTFDRKRYAPASGLQRGGYVLADTEGEPDVILIGTGSEVQWCVDAVEPLKKDGIAARVVSLPCWELFDRQDQKYRDEVLPPGITARVAIEQAATMGWERYVGLAGRVIGMRSFGASAPFADVREEFGFTTDNVVETARALVRGEGR